MSKTMVFIKLTGQVIVMLLLAIAIGFIGLAAYSEGYTNGERVGSLFTTQYVAQKCHEGGKLELFGKTYYCGEIQKL